MTNLTRMDHVNIIEQVAYDNLDRNFEYMNDEEIDQMENLLKVVRNLRKQETLYDAKSFYKTYEDRYDYLYDTLDRGFTLQLFVREYPQYSLLIGNDNLEHFSDIPLEARLQYRTYLENYLRKHWGRDGEYTEQDAIHDFRISNITRKDEMIEALRKFGEAYSTLLGELMHCEGCDLNQTDAIAKYPFDKSFEELDVLDWVMETIEELQR